MRDVDVVFENLGRSEFRQKFRLNAKDCEYLQEKGWAQILQHAEKFVEQRLAPAHPTKDGKQTPFRGHPVFVAQHATATCCRSGLAKWHGITKGLELSSPQRTYVVAVIERWLRLSCGAPNASKPNQLR
jgi:Domain of unknown function (DUF4186)